MRKIEQHIDEKGGVLTVCVPAGKFLMGSTLEHIAEISKQGGFDYYNAEMPQHEVAIIEKFWIDQFPVTNAAYQKFIDDGGYATQRYWSPAGWKWMQQNKEASPVNYDGFTADNQPRVGVTWFESYAYCTWRSGRLPTEAEWEYAARGSECRIYPWGNDFLTENLVFAENSGGKTAAVGNGIRTGSQSWIGAYDLVGNIWEWCSSLYRSYPYDPNDGREITSDDDQRTLRGGSWDNFPLSLRATCRIGKNADDEDYSRGFRCVSSQAKF